MPASSPDEAQATQEAVAALAVPSIRAAWSLWDASRVAESLPMFREAVGAVVGRYGQAASALSVQHFRAVRSDAGLAGRVDVPPVFDVPDGFIDEAMVEALAEAEADIEKAMAYLNSQAEHLILEQGRRQMFTAVQADRAAKGWARVANPGACSFCLMLALRAGAGLLYRSKAGANFRAHTRRPNGSGGDCKCTVEPVFGQYEPPARVREAAKVWTDATKGRSGRDARTAFRQAIEGREVTGSKRSGPKRTDAPKFEGASRTPENQRFQLELLENLPPAKTPEAAEWRRARMAEIRKYLGQ